MTKLMGTLLLAVAAFTVQAAYNAAGGYVTLRAAGTTANDSPLNWSTPNDSKAGAFWSDGLAMHAGTNYYIGSGYARSPYGRYAPYAYDESGTIVTNMVMPANKLVLENAQISFKCYDPFSYSFANEGLVCGPKAVLAVNDGAQDLDFIVGGLITLEGTTSGNPFKVSPQNGLDRQFLRFDAKVRTTATTDHLFVPRGGKFGTLKLFGDMTDFHGGITVNSNAVWLGTSGLSSPDATLWLNQQAVARIAGTVGATVPVHRISVNSESRVEVSSANTLAIQQLQLAAETELRFELDAPQGRNGTIVAESITLPTTGLVRIGFTAANASMFTNTPTRLELLRAPHGTIPLARFAPAERRMALDVPCVVDLAVEQDGDQDVLSASWAQIVTMTTSNTGAANASKFFQASYWSNNKTPDENAGFDFLSQLGTYLCRKPGSSGLWVFPGRSLNLTSTTTVSQSGDYWFDRLVLGPNITFRSWTGANSIVDMGGHIYLHGGSSDMLTILEGNSMRLRWSANLHGECQIGLRARKPDTIGNESRIYFEPTAANTNFFGKWNLSYATDTTSYRYINPTQYISIVVCESSNLGAPLPTFAYDALEIRQWQALMASDGKGVVSTLDDATRGIHFLGDTYVEVKAGNTLNLSSPVTYSGHMRKMGGGLLALGGAKGPRFCGAQQLTTPRAGTNVLEVVEGAIKPLTARSANGLAFVFGKDSSGIVLDSAPADADVAQYGFIDTAWATPFARAEGVMDPIPVTVDVSGLSDMPDAVSSYAICTVPADQAETLRSLFAVAKPPFPNYETRVDVRANVDGTVTLLAVISRGGFMVIIR